MALSEIEKLERRYAENPQGLTFAPLAEVHRKSGDIARALELLQPGLQLHPDYIPASIVLGRCHFDLGDLPAAEIAFAHVLELDGENVIALKALADINERLDRFDQVERWLQQLLSVDRSNDDARMQLERIEAARAQASEAAARSAEVEAVEFQTGNAGPIAQPTTEAPEEPSPATVPEAEDREDSEPEPLTLVELEYSTIAEADEPRDVLLLEETEPVERPVEPLAGLIGPDTDSPAEGFLVETGEDIVLRSSGGSEFQMPDASLEFASAAAPSEPAGLGETPKGEGPSEPAYSEPASSWRPSMEELPEEEAARVEPPEAKSPASKSPDEPRETPSSEAAVEPARQTFAAAESGGESVGRFFQRLLAARPPAIPGVPATHAPTTGRGPAEGEGAPTRPAADALSLSSVFGEEAGALPPAVQAPGAPAAGVSFDEFFSPPGAAPGARTQRSPDTKSDDLDQFHAWLQNLKR